MRINSGETAWAAIDRDGKIALPILRTKSGARRVAIWYSPCHPTIQNPELKSFGDLSALNTAELTCWRASSKNGWRIERVSINIQP